MGSEAVKCLLTGVELDQRLLFSIPEWFFREHHGYGAGTQDA